MNMAVLFWWLETKEQQNGYGVCLCVFDVIDIVV